MRLMPGLLRIHGTSGALIPGTAHASGTGMARRAVRSVLLVGVSSLLAGCVAAPSGYAGTGSLSVSGSTTQPLLASHSVHFGSCRDPGDPYNPLMGFSIVTIGDACVMDGTGEPSEFRADPGTVCTLTFSDRPHPIRVTDFAARFGVTSVVSGRTYIDPNYLQVELGGDDAATGTHVLYRFSGNASTDAPWTTACDAERTKRASRGELHGVPAWKQ
jgi:hypothetical protein